MLENGVLQIFVIVADTRLGSLVQSGRQSDSARLRDSDEFG